MSDRIAVPVDELDELRRCLSSAALNRLAASQCPEGEQAIERMTHTAEKHEREARDIVKRWARRDY